MKVVIGAGPAGLYTAIKLKKAGIQDIVVYDPRAGMYTRPGTLNYAVFVKAKQGTGANIDEALLSGARYGHIKDLERQLYNEATRLGIRIETKSFKEFRPHKSKPAVVIEDAAGTKEIVETDYVFDCTGTRRQVIHAVNALFAEPPFKITTFTDLPVKNHFIAYVKIPSQDYSFLRDAIEAYTAMGSLLSDSLTDARLFLKLRCFGWHEFKFPDLYCHSFGKKGDVSKACLYLHAPDGLRREDYDQWVQTVIECYAPSIHFEHYPASRKYVSKPRFMSFELNAKALTTLSYKGENLPTVLPLGDAQIDFDYTIGHGISDGMKRIDVLFKNMVVFEDHIDYFGTRYLKKIDQLLLDHKTAIIREAELLKASFSKELQSAQYKFREAFKRSSSAAEKSSFTAILAEIEARLSYNRATAMFAQCHDATHKISFSPANISAVTAKLNAIHGDLLNAHTNLPASFISEQHHTQTLLTYLAESWRSIGDTLVTHNKQTAAIDAFNKAIAIYNLPYLAEQHTLKELSLYNNLVIAYLKAHHFHEAIAAGKTALATYVRCELEIRPAAVYEEIVFNLIKAICAKIKVLLFTRQRAEAISLRSQAQQLIDTHKTALVGDNYLRITTMMQELQASFTASNPALAAAALRRAEGFTALRLPITRSEAMPTFAPHVRDTLFRPARALRITRSTPTGAVASPAEAMTDVEGDAAAGTGNVLASGKRKRQ